MLPPLRVGAILRSRYRISNILYKSPMTNIYKVDDTHLEGNVWALKEMKVLAIDNFERQKMISKFRTDFIRMTELSHPNFTRVIDFFEENQNLYILREFIPGYDIGTILSRATGFINEKDVLNWSIQLADVFMYLYKKKFPPVFFKDLNLISILVDSQNDLKVIDLGLAWLFQAESDMYKMQNMGSVEYAAPEQYEGNGSFDQRSLIYSLGAIMHHILTKRSPTQHLFNLPPVESINPEVSRPTRWIIKRATENKPQNRFPTLLEMKKHLQQAYKKPEKSFKFTPQKAQPSKAAKIPKPRKDEKPVKPKAEKEPMSDGVKLNIVLILVILGLLTGAVYLIYSLIHS
jgi:serine/threonine protein kinase